MSTPEDKPVERKGKEPEPQPSRWAKLVKADKDVELPDVGFDFHITDWLKDLGPLASGGMSSAPISWQEMAAWMSLTGWQPSPWEAETLSAMSRAYLAQVEDSNGAKVPPPYMSATAQSAEQRKQVSVDLGKIIDGIMAAQKKGKA